MQSVSTNYVFIKKIYLKDAPEFALRKIFIINPCNAEDATEFAKKNCALLLTLVAVQWFNPCLSVLQVLSCHDILQPPHIDFFQEVYPFTRLLTQPLCWQWPVSWSMVISF